jgi:hypothetical protein
VSLARSTHPFPPVVGAESQAGDDWSALIFLHIPKTAGLNLRHVINWQYGLDSVCQAELLTDPAKGPYWRYLEEGVPLKGKGRPGHDPNQQARRAIRQFCQDRLGRVRVVMGHLFFGIHDTLPREATYVTILREPVERVLSVYYHRVHRHGLRLSLEHYVRTGRDFQIDNAQTRAICGPLRDGDVRFVPCTTDMLERAKRNLREHFSMVGVAERFDETYLLMARTYAWRPSGYHLYNVNRRRPRGEKVPPGIRKQLAERNHYDAELYAFAQELFEEQLGALDPPIDERVLRGFRRSNLLHRYVALRRLYPVARPLLRTGRAIGRGARGLLPGRSA